MAGYRFGNEVAEIVNSSKKIPFMVDGVRAVMLNKEGYAFRILPAFPEKPCAPDAWVTFRDTQGELTNWGRVIFVNRFVGHRGGTQRDILSLHTFDPTDACPMYELIAFVKRSPEWRYLQDRTRTADGKEDAAPLAKGLDKMLLCNIMSVAEPHLGAQIALMTAMPLKSLLEPGGLATQLNAGIPKHLLASEPMLQWACGDITSPVDGPVLEIKKENKPGSFAGNKVDYRQAMHNTVARMSVPSDVLASRYDLENLDSIVQRPTRNDIISALVKVFNRFSPSGVHEYEMLRQVFGHEYNIPASPSTGVPVSNSLPAAPAMGTAHFDGFNAARKTPPPPLPAPPPTATPTLPWATEQAAPAYAGHAGSIPMNPAYAAPAAPPATVMAPPATMPAPAQPAYRAPAQPAHQPPPPQDAEVGGYVDSGAPPATMPAPDVSAAPVVPGDPPPRLSAASFLQTLNARK
jgi:hypothetical protein